MCVWWEGGPFGATMCSSSEPAVFSLHTHNTVQVGRESWLAVYPVCLCTVCACRVGDALQAAA